MTSDHDKTVVENGPVLSKEALSDLRAVLNQEIGEVYTALLSDGDLEDIGLFLLTTLAIGIKMRCR